MINLGKSSLVDQVTYALQVGVAPGNIGFTDTEHVDSGLVQFDKHSVVDLSQPEKLENLADLRCYFVDTETQLQTN